jgi:diguanylate cyclase (GGDEF)-like protein
MAELDRFKTVNDSFGHTAGDRALKLVAKFLQKNIRDVDILSRYGGEEFVFLLPEADKEEAYTVSERLRKKLSEQQFDELPRITISLGIASYPDDSDDIDQLIKKADAALYTAKQAGRNKVVVYEEEMELIEVDEPLPSDSLKAAN